MPVFSLGKPSALKEEATLHLIPKAQAQGTLSEPEALTFKPTVAQAVKAENNPTGRYWVLQERFCTPDCEYKNKILVALQKKLIASAPDLGSTDRKKFVMQLYQENGSLDIWSTHGDSGHAVGLGQWNVGNARAWLAANCAKNAAGKCDYELELERQLTQLAFDMVGAWKTYKGNIKLAIVDHNRPRSAQLGQDQCLAGPTDRNDAGIKDCYYAEQVLQHEDKFTLL